MRLRRNIVAGIANSTWTAIVGLAAVPIYLRFLGIENYGLIGFYATLQAVLQLLDMGLAPTMNRELARSKSQSDFHRARSLLRTLEVIYCLSALAISACILGLSPWIAEHWLQAKTVSDQSLRSVIALMGLLVACRWPIGLYQGALMGMQRLAVSSTVNMAAVTIGAAASVTVLAFVSPTVEAFFICQATIAFIQVLVMRRLAWRAVGTMSASAFDLNSIRRVWRFSAGMGGIAVASIVLMQLDKVLLSTLLSLREFGHYVLAGVAASCLYVVLTPVFNVIYPRMTQLYATNQLEQLKAFFSAGTRLLASVLFPLAIAGALFSKDLMLLWTGDANIAMSVGPIASILLIGTSLNGVMHFPLALQLAAGRSSLTFAITVSLAIMLVPLILLFTLRFGAIGSAAAWLLLNFCYLLAGSWITHRLVLVASPLAWLVRDVGAPMLSSAAIVLCGWAIFSTPTLSLGNSALGVILGAVAVLANIWLFPFARLRLLTSRELSAA